MLVDEFHTHSQALNRAFLNSPTHHLDSYPQMAWPADNVTALASLLVHDQLYNTHYRDEAYATWKAWTLNHSDPDTGLPAGKLNIDTGEHRQPSRGCATSLMIAMLGQLDPDFADTLYTQYTTHLGLQRLGVRMFREWPAHTDLAGDLDSGPIIWGAGVTATGVGLAAARRMGDIATEADIYDLSRTLGAPQMTTFEERPSVRYLGGMLPVGDLFLTWSLSIARPTPLEIEALPTVSDRLLQRWSLYLLLALIEGVLLLQMVWIGRSSYARLREHAKEDPSGSKN